MRVDQVLSGYQEQGYCTPAPPAPPADPVVKQGTTAEGYQYTVTVTGGTAADREHVMKVDGFIAQPAPVIIDSSLVRGSLDPRTARPVQEATPEPAPVPEPRQRTEVTEEETLPEGVRRYRQLRDRVWGKLRKDLHHHEALQRQLKMLLRSHGFGGSGHSLLLKACRKNGTVLTCLRHVLEFLRSGIDAHYSELFFNLQYAKHPSFRNDFWTFWNMKHPNGPGSRATRSTLVPDTDNLQAGDVVPPTGESPAAAVPETPYPEHEMDPVETVSELDAPPPTTPDTPAVTPNAVVDQAPDEGSGVPVRCETCGCFVSQISRCCSRCGRRY